MPRCSGEFAAREASQRRLLTLGLLSLLGILLILHVDFGSVRLVALVALTLPFALVGGVAAAFLSGGVLSLGSLVGFVTVLGHRRAQRHHAGQPLPAPAGVRRACRSDATSSSAAPRSGSPRSS